MLSLIASNRLRRKKKGGFEDEELESIVLDQAGMTNSLWKISGLQVSTGMSGIPTATVKLIGPDMVERYVATTGTGPVDAVYKAIDLIMGVSVELETYQLSAVNEGIEAMAVTRVSISPKEGGPNDSPSMHSQSGVFKNRKFSGSGSDTDIMTSSARAYVSALNKLLSWNARRSRKMASDPEEESSESVVSEPIQVTAEVS